MNAQIPQDKGQEEADVSVTIGPRFLNLFSQQLYSSQNKAFEELVANSWDAGAENVYLKVPEDLEKETAAVWVLDDGKSMDLEGLELLWSVANSEKRERNEETDRKQIGKFGIGKLATYVLAHELTYFCRADDGQIRYVTMDYRRIDKQAKNKDNLHVEKMDLKVRKISMDELNSILSKIDTGNKAFELIREGVPQPDRPEDYSKEYGHQPTYDIEEKDTWTLAVLTSLKEKGQDLQTGWIRRILSSALPLGSGINIVLNDELIEPSKTDVPILDKWELGKKEWNENDDDISIEQVERTNANGDIIEERDVEFLEEPFPHIKIEDIDGKITGEVKIYQDKISGGKSEDVGKSNGFFVNILGRVVNQSDHYFELENLKKAVWIRFRATIRADWLDENLRVNREDLEETKELKLFRSLLRKFFNKARSLYEDIHRSDWPEVGDTITENWEAVPLEPLASFTRERLDEIDRYPDLVQINEDTDIEELKSEFQQITEDEPSSLLQGVSFSDGFEKEDSIAIYDLDEKKIKVNYNHPFILEYTKDHESQKYIRNLSTIEILSYLHMIETGVTSAQFKDIIEHRDQLFKTFAHLNRRNAIQIAKLLDEVDDHDDALEEIVGDALDFIGYSVQRLSRGDDSGVIDGVATAPLPAKSPEHSSDKSEEDLIPSYKIAYDAKSTKHKKVKTGNIGMGNLPSLRDQEEADYILVIGKDFQDNRKLNEGCQNNDITPMRTGDLADLVMLSAKYGALNLRDLEDILRLRKPDEVEEWIDEYVEKLEDEPRPITHGVVLKALKKIGHSSRNAIGTDRIAAKIEEISGTEPKRREVMSAFRGLEILVPNLVKTNPSDRTVYVSNKPEKIEQMIDDQVKKLPREYQSRLEQELDLTNEC